MDVLLESDPKNWLLGGFKIIHKMNLWNDSFIAIKEGWKAIGMKLNDDKRRIKTGDIIGCAVYGNGSSLS